MLKREEQTDRPWRLRGLSLQVALFAGAVFFAGAVLAVAVDLYSEDAWDSPTLQAWTLVPQTVSSAGLFYIGRRQRSVAFYGLGALIGLVVVEEAFHVLNPISEWLADVSHWAQNWTDVRLGVFNGILLYGLVATVGIAMLLLSHWYGSEDERPVVRHLALLLLAGGFFGGPISMVSRWGIHRQWIFVEEFGEAIVFAAIAGYVVGLAMRSRSGAIR